MSLSIRNQRIFKRIYTLAMKNYYQIHKNKKPKSIARRKRKYIDLSNVQCAMITASSCFQVAKIQSQPLLVPHSMINKTLKIAEICLDTYKSMVNIKKQEQIRKFKITKRYT